MPDLTTAQKVLATAMKESELQDAILELAERLGWYVHAERPARTIQGWRTPIQGKPGYPDLTLCRLGTILWIECKSERGRLTEEQNSWLSDLNANKTCAHWFRPSAWLSGDIERLLL